MAAETLFYDGACGLCHRTVRFAAAADRRGERFRFAPLGGSTFQRLVAPETATGLPDSLVLLRQDGRLLVRSAALLHLLRQLGGPWSALAAVVGLLPERLRDRAYDLLAAHRQRLAARPSLACPVLPEALRARFDP